MIRLDISNGLFFDGYAGRTWTECFAGLGRWDFSRKFNLKNKVSFTQNTV